jgi:metalloendopeptidase OMA1, mitochondrial
VIGADYDWRAALLSSPDVNAFALPGGKIAVLSGMLRVADTEDELAAVIAHAVGHVVARHGQERITQQQLAEWGQMAVGVALGDMDPATRAAVLGALGVGAQFGVLMPFSRTHEAEADAIGLVLMARACYDPRAAVQVWRDMARAGRGQPPEFLSTHPRHESRIAALEARMDEALAEYREAGCPPLEGV